MVGHDEEIYGNPVLGVIPEKSLPCLGGRFPVADHLFGHGRLTHFDSDLQQFPMNASRSPARVGVAHLTDEVANFRRYRRAAIAMPTFPSPIKPKSLAMPPDDSLRLDHPQRRSPIVPQGAPNPQGSVSPTETQVMTAAGTFEDQ